MAELSDGARIDRVRPGQRTLAASAWNRMAQALEGRQRVGLQLADAGDAVAVRVTLVAVGGGDWLTVADALTGERFQALKPPRLRPSETSRDGVSYTYAGPQTRTADDGTDTETQIVIPSYLIGDELIVLPYYAPEGAVWIDGNVDARAWAREAA